MVLIPKKKNKVYKFQNITQKEINTSIYKIGENYKNYKKDWCFSLKQLRDNQWLIHCESRCDHRIMLDKIHELKKSLYLFLEEKDQDLILTTSFRCTPRALISISISPWFYLITFFISTIILIPPLGLSAWFPKAIPYIQLYWLWALIFTPFQWYKRYKFINTEEERYSIMYEVLQKQFKKDELL